MKILIVNQYAIPPIQTGGTRHFTLAKELKNLGHDVTIIAANFNHQTKTKVINNSNDKVLLIEHDGIPFIWINVTPYYKNDIARVKNLIDFSYALLNNSLIRKSVTPDIIIGSSPSPLAALIAERMAARLKVPFIFEIRDMWPQSLIDLGRINRRNPAIILMKILEKHLLRRGVRIITLLPGAVKYIEKCGIPSNKVVWIPNGIDKDLFSLDLDKNKKNKNDFILIYAGNHAPGNGLDTILKSAEILMKKPEYPIVFRLIGDGSEKKSLQQIAREKKIKNIEFYDAVPKNEIPALLQEADVFLMMMKDSPVFQWGISPNKLHDYLYSARPIIFSVNAFNNPVKEAGAGLTIPPENPEALTEAILKLYKMSASERQEMGRRGREYVEKHHDFVNLAKKLEVTFQDVIYEYHHKK